MSDEPPSFNPHTWLKLDGVDTRPAPPVPSASLSRRHLLYWAGAGSIFVVGGAAVAWVSRRPKAPAPATAAAPHNPSATPLSRRSMVLTGSGELRSALAAAELTPSEVDATTQAALRVIGAAKGQLHAVLTLGTGGTRPILQRLELLFDDSSGVVVVRAADGSLAATPVAASLTRKIVVRGGQMDAESFYSSAVAAGVIDSLVSDVARALAFDFDFQREIKAGDVFEIGWEQDDNAQGRSVGVPRLRFVSLATAAKSLSLYWFQPQGEEGGWFNDNGMSVVRALMRTPVDGARVSSTFGMRVHPIEGFAKMHKGIDFAAPIGTPIFAAGDGIVEWAEMKGANGNLTILRHDNGWLTYYLHQSVFMPGVVKGARVKQGQHIGNVGTTGHSTGPHLHYEVHVDGEPVDPASIKSEASHSLAGAARDAFLRERARIDQGRAAAGAGT